ncbi:DUF397 domain-containing protein [Streptomyces sp. NPDC003077]|uniref:DUF397 domain-containing protein n=1 Tax=Streptomyces sp. NPDC003077 TaxID=3154443 RepID=UPI0033A62607
MDLTAWQRSTSCGGGGNNCMEVAAPESSRIALRESTSPTQILTTHPTTLHALLRTIKAGRLA